MPLLALDLFASIVAMRINADPFFSALFTLWLSMIAAKRLPQARTATQPELSARRIPH